MTEDYLYRIRATSKTNHLLFQELQEVLSRTSTRLTIDDSQVLVIETAEKPIKVVFDNGMQIIDESELDSCEDMEAASEEELNMFIEGLKI